MQAEGRLAKLPKQTPGDGLLNPVVLASIAILLLNDHVWKGAYPGLVTGKVSDFAGLIVFPVALVAAYELGSRIALGRRVMAGPRAITIAAATTAIAFALVKLSPQVNMAVSALLGDLQWLAGLEPGAHRPRNVVLAMDPTDLVALVAVGAAIVIGLRRSRLAAQ